jgi:hypothetical protein
MDRYDDTHDPKNPPHSVTHTKARSAALTSFVGSLVVFFVLVGIALIFWTVAHPGPAARDEEVIGTSGYYSTEGGHDPIRRPASTRDELTFRGRLTPPTEAPNR